MAARDIARAEPVAVAKHGRPVIVVTAVEEFERLRSHDPATEQLHPSTRTTTTT